MGGEQHGLDGRARPRRSYLCLSISLSLAHTHTLAIALSLSLSLSLSIYISLYVSRRSDLHYFFALPLHIYMIFWTLLVRT